MTLVSWKIEGLGYDDMLDVVINKMAGEVMERLQQVGCCNAVRTHVILSDMNQDDVWSEPSDAIHEVKNPG